MKQVFNIPSPSTDNHEATRTALLQAGAQVFAAQGFIDARVRDIASAAGCNLSAINYHYGSKEGLYLAVIAHAAEQTVARHPLPVAAADAGASAALPDETQAGELLLALVQALLERFLVGGESSLMAQLLIREMSKPTQALEHLVENVARHQFAAAASVVTRLIGPGHPAETLRACVLSLMGQCLLYVFARPVFSRLFPGLYQQFDSAALAAHITRFSLPGLLALRRPMA